MEKERSIKILTIIALIVSVLCLTVALATISSTIDAKNELIDEGSNNQWIGGIDIEAEIDKDQDAGQTSHGKEQGKGQINIQEKQDSIWSVRFKNLEGPFLTGSAKIKKSPNLTKNSTVIDDFDVTFLKTGDSVAYSFDVVNDGNIDAKISSIVKLTPVCNSAKNIKEDENMVCQNIKYTLTYTDTGKEVSGDDVLDANKKRNLTLKLSYNGDSLPSEVVEISDLSIVIIYVQK